MQREACDYWQQERAALRQVLYPAPRPWPAAVAEEQARLLARLTVLGAEIERLRREPDRPLTGATAVLVGTVLVLAPLALPLLAVCVGRSW